MPHSTSPAEPAAEPEDTIITENGPDTAAAEVQAADMEALGLESPGEDSANVENADEDITMAESGVQGEPVPDMAQKQDIKLEDLFADEDSDEEFPSSIVNIKQASSPQAPLSPVSVPQLCASTWALANLQSHIGPSSTASDPEVMRSFYQRLFPWKPLFQWLNHSPTPSTDFGHREFAFTLQNDAYLRYQSFPNSEL